MKKIVLFSAVLVSLFFSVDSFSKKSKEDKDEEKKWKKELKKVEWSDYKKLKESESEKAKSLKNCISNSDAFENQLTESQNDLSTCQASLSQITQRMNDEVKKAKENLKLAQLPEKQLKQTDFDRGVVFRVQLGAFEKLTIAKTYSDNNDNFNQENENGLNKFAIGAFRDYKDADSLKKYMRKMGAKDAWVVSYRDGKRVPIKDVLDAIK